MKWYQIAFAHLMRQISSLTMPNFKPSSQFSPKLWWFLSLSLKMFSKLVLLLKRNVISRRF